MISEAYNMDCMDFMKDCKDKQFDLAIVDPPYGIGINHNMGRRKGQKPSPHKPAVWDKTTPNANYFNELFRISKNQIIWGANYFITFIALDSPCWLMWDKEFSEDITFSQFELAWTSFKTTTKKFTLNPNNENNHIHPTQKPVKLYKWLLKNYAKEGDKIIDTHLGSGSSRIACYDYGFDFWGMELDKDYFEAQEKRFKNHIAQVRMFA